jgi:hypothetical protein
VLEWDDNPSSWKSNFLAYNASVVKSSEVMFLGVKFLGNKYSFSVEGAVKEVSELRQVSSFTAPLSRGNFVFTIDSFS